MTQELPDGGAIMSTQENLEPQPIPITYRQDEDHKTSRLVNSNPLGKIYLHTYISELQQMISATMTAIDDFEQQTLLL